MPNAVVHVFDTFRRRYMDQDGEKKKYAYKQLMHDVHAIYQNIQKERRREAQVCRFVCQEIADVRSRRGIRNRCKL